MASLASVQGRIPPVSSPVLSQRGNLRRAAIKDQTTAGIELFTNFAHRLLRTYTAQVEALKTYRSKGEQKVEVEHVHVHRGGQAIVGAVSHTSAGSGGGHEQ
jgi:hypothetical protein